MTWMKDVPQLDLNELHFALRLAAERRDLREEQVAMFDRLADACWEENCRRAERARKNRVNLIVARLKALL